MSKSGLTAFLIKELKELLPPPVFFCGWLQSHRATTTALVVGKSVLVANAVEVSDAIATLTIVRRETKLGKLVVKNPPVNATGQRR